MSYSTEWRLSFHPYSIARPCFDRYCRSSMATNHFQITVLLLASSWRIFKILSSTLYLSQQVVVPFGFFIHMLLCTSPRQCLTESFPCILRDYREMNCSGMRSGGSTVSSTPLYLYQRIIFLKLLLSQIRGTILMTAYFNCKPMSFYVVFCSSFACNLSSRFLTISLTCIRHTSVSSSPMIRVC